MGVGRETTVARGILAVFNKQNRIFSEFVVPFALLFVTESILASYLPK